MHAKPFAHRARRSLVPVLTLLGTLLIMITATASASAADTVGGGADASWGALFGRMHVLVLHLPIGLLIGAFTLELLGLLRRSKGYDIAAAWMFILGALSSVPAVVSGLLLAVEKNASAGGQETALSIIFTSEAAGVSETMGWHMWAGIILMFAAFAAGVLKIIAVNRQWPDDDVKHPERGGWPLGVARLSLIGSMALMPLAGHLGGNMVHGPEYLFEKSPIKVGKGLVYFPEEAPKPPITGDANAPLGSAGFWYAEIQPALDTHCIGCHGPTKQDGKLRLDSLEWAMKGGATANLEKEALRRPTIEPGEARDSEIYVRVALPQSHQLFMPTNTTKYGVMAKDKVELLGNWIQEFDGNVDDADRPKDDKLDIKKKVPDGPLADTLGTVAYWDKHIQPVLNMSCVPCHGEKKPKVGIRFDSLKQAMDGLTIEPGKATDSDIYRVVTLPPSHEYFMPPKDEEHPRLTLDQIYKLGEWITKYKGQLEDKPVKKDGEDKGEDKKEDKEVTQAAPGKAKPAKTINTQLAPEAETEGKTVPVVSLADRLVKPAAAEPEQGTKAYWEKNIQPVFNDHCVSCHGPDKQKAKLRLDTLDWALKGGSSAGDENITAGDARWSELYVRISLPPSHDEFMPPNPKKHGQLSPKEVVMVGEWIQAYEGDPSKPKKPKSDDKTTTAPVLENFEALANDIRKTGAVASSLSQKQSGLLDVSFNYMKGLSASDIATLKPAAKAIYWLSFMGSPMDDKLIAKLPDLPALTKLNLSNTDITDTGLAALPSMPKLDNLVLFNTAITDKGLETLAKLKSLKAVTLGATEVTAQGVKKLKAALPDAKIVSDFGDQFRETFTEEGKKEKEKSTKADKPINTKCPVSGAAVKPGFVSTYKGKTVGFCCNNCKAKFDADPDKFVGKLP